VKELLWFKITKIREHPSKIFFTFSGRLIKTSKMIENTTTFLREFGKRDRILVKWSPSFPYFSWKVFPTHPKNFILWKK